MSDGATDGAGRAHEPNFNSRGDRLDSWKEIAAYLGRSIRTVQQWERTEDLPIHRLQHSKYGSVYALQSELDAWRVVRTALAATAGSKVPKSEDRIGGSAATETASGNPSRSRTIWTSGLVVVALAAVSLGLIREKAPVTHDVRYTQITNFTDSAVAPAISPNGDMLAFYRSDSWFHTPDQIYIKLLPKGEPVPLTNDKRLKYGLTFSPDGSRIAYTVEERTFQTFTVSPLGGEPRLLLANAAGLSWLDERHVLFSEIRPGTGAHMGIVTATEDRSDYRRLYFPEHERAMAHYSYASPDRKWALVVEMDPVWQPCRLIALDGASRNRQVGPRGQCTSAGWSPDGKWMYFAAAVDGQHHLWRQRFPAGSLEQITAGPTEEDGIAVDPDGHSLITSIGIHENALWISDAGSDRPLSSEGHVTMMPASMSQITNHLASPSTRFSPDGTFLFYLMRRDSAYSPAELWRKDLSSGKSEPILPGVSMSEYDISDDGDEVVFSKVSQGSSQIWLARLDGSSPPKLLASSGETAPHFGPDRQVLFQFTDGRANYIGCINRDSLQRSKISPFPIAGISGISPDRRWILANVPQGYVAIPVDGKSPRPICNNLCVPKWAPDGRFLYVGLMSGSQTSPGKTVAIPIPSGETFPNLPAAGIRGLDEGAALPGARMIERWNISPGPDPSVYAYLKTTVQRNLFRVLLPR